jgi:hypothetical protein
MKKRSLLVAAFIAVIVQAQFAAAQKLPATQQVSLRAPVNYKVTGKATEWDNQFQAYNKATDLFYTIANDDENLYLIVQAVKPRIIQKIINVGLALTINNTGKKNSDAKENVAITYPLLDLATGGRILYSAGAMAKSDVKIPERPANAPGRPDTTRYSLTHTDSLIAVANKLLTKTATEIKVKGIPGLADEPLSVYNEEKIKVSATFDPNGAYTYKLAIPLKYLGLTIDNLQKFAYNIKLAGRLDEHKHGLTVTYYYDRSSGGPPRTVDPDADINNATDFSGEYTLAKK